MKKLFKISSLGAAVALLLASCSNEDIMTSGEGTLLLSAKITSEVQEASRADLSATDEELAADCEVWISNEKGRIYKYVGLDQIPPQIRLLSGSYVAEAWTGDSVPASFEKRWFKGMAKFDVKADASTRVTLNCKIANTLVAVNYDETVGDVLDNYTMTVSHSRGNLVYDANEDRTGYFMMPSADNDLNWVLEGTTKSGQKFTKEGKIEGVKHTAADGSHQAYKYTLNVKCTPSSEDFGGLVFNVDVDAELATVETEVGVVVAPIIEGYGFDLSQPVMGEMKTLPRRSVIVKSAIELSSVVLESEDLPFDDGASVDLIGVSEMVKNELLDGGIAFDYSVNEADGTSMMKINFQKLFADKLENGTHPVKITATDKEGRISTATLTYIVSDAAVVPDEPKFADVSPYRATLRGTVSKEGVEEVYFRYRRQGDEAWTRVEAEADIAIPSRAFNKDTKVKAELTELAPGTTYEWQMVADDWATDTQSFSTKTAEQIPNAGFEEWCKSGNSYIPAATADSRWWDSGNHGSTSLGASFNITTQISSPRHGGESAISLKSTLVLIKFAAGNVFAGKYLKTDGTNGILGWGRPFTSRPKQMKVWAHYKPVVIDRNDGDYTPEGYEKNKNNMDKGTIYIALMDNHTESYEGENYPVVIKTNSKTLRLFDAYGSDKEHVIA